MADWRELEGMEFEFPVNPEDGYVDGSIYVDGQHASADVTRLRFGRIAGGAGEVTLDVVLEFLGEVGEDPSVTWTVPLSFDATGLDEVIAEAVEAGALPTDG